MPCERHPFILYKGISTFSFRLRGTFFPLARKTWFRVVVSSTSLVRSTSLLLQCLCIVLPASFWSFQTASWNMRETFSCIQEQIAIIDLFDCTWKGITNELKTDLVASSCGMYKRSRRRELEFLRSSPVLFSKRGAVAIDERSIWRSVLSGPTLWSETNITDELLLQFDV